MKKVAFATLAFALLSTHASALTSTSDLSSNWPSQSKMEREDRLSLGQEKPVMFNGKHCMVTTPYDDYARCDLTEIVPLPICPRIIENGELKCYGRKRIIQR